MTWENRVPTDDVIRKARIAKFNTASPGAPCAWGWRPLPGVYHWQGRVHAERWSLVLIPMPQKTWRGEAFVWR